MEFYKNQRVGNHFVNINIVFYDDLARHKYVSCYIWEINRRAENGERLDDAVIDKMVSRRDVLNDCLFQVYHYLKAQELDFPTCAWQIRSYGNCAIKECFENLLAELNSG